MQPREGGYIGRQQAANDAVESDQITEDAYNRLWRNFIPNKIKELKSCPCSCTSVTVRVIVGNDETLDNLNMQQGVYRYNFPSGGVSYNENE